MKKRVTINTILYRVEGSDKYFVGEVKSGEEYSTPDSTLIFEGTLQEFKQQHPKCIFEDKIFD